MPLDIAQFRSAGWFTRGWTLQELIAPRHVAFIASGWSFIGNKSDQYQPSYDLAPLIQDIPGVDLAVLRDSNRSSIMQLSVANRMFWASQRHTTRVEDTAYCLLGLFDISMPMLYGEGGKAFIRFQEELLKVSENHSVFAFGQKMEIPLHDNWAPEWNLLLPAIERKGWEIEQDSIHDGGAWERQHPMARHCFLASSPADFRYGTSIVSHPHHEDAELSLMTKRCLRIKLQYLLQGGRSFAKLDCHLADDINFILAVELISAKDNTMRRRSSALILILRAEEARFKFCDLYLSRYGKVLSSDPSNINISVQDNDGTYGWLIT